RARGTRTRRTAARARLGAVAARHLCGDLLGAVGDELHDLGRLVLHEVLHGVDLALHDGRVPELGCRRLDLLVALAPRARAEHVSHAESGEEEDLAFHGAPFSATRWRGGVTWAPIQTNPRPPRRKRGLRRSPNGRMRRLRRD